MKERIFKFQVGMIIGFGLAVFLLFATIFLWDRLYPLPYRISQPVTQPASTPADNGELTARVENLENDQNYNLKVFEWKLDQKLLILGWVALFISFAAGFMGLKTYNDLDKVIKEKINKSLEKTLYQLDPTNLPIHIYTGRTRRSTDDKTPRTAARDSVHNVNDRLRLTGLLNRGFINYLDKNSLLGITVLPMDDEDDEQEFFEFIKNYKDELNYEKAGFILYAPFGYTIKTAMDAFPNTVIANMPATVASMVLVVGRGLKNLEDA